MKISELDIPIGYFVYNQEQAQENHGGQSVHTLELRGGLSICEAVAILENREWQNMDPVDAAIRLGELLKSITPFKDH